MSWYTVSKPAYKGYYFVVDPEVYYEWQFNGFVPKETQAYYGNTRHSKSLSQAVLAVLDPEIPFKKKGDRFLSEANIPLNAIKFVSGITKSKEEILTRKNQLERRFRTGLDRFIEAMTTRGYFVKSSDNKANLYYIAKHTPNQAEIINYGPWDEIVKKAKTKQSMLHVSRKPSHFVARDLSELHNLTHSLIDIDSKRPVDRNRIVTILKSAEQGQVSQHVEDWKSLYKKLSYNAQVMNKQLERISNFQWIKAACQEFR